MVTLIPNQLRVLIPNVITQVVILEKMNILLKGIELGAKSEDATPDYHPKLNWTPSAPILTPPLIRG